MFDPEIKARLSKRQSRVLEALLFAAAPIFREDIDRIAGASNGPEIIAQLRHQWGIDIHMERVERLDRDGRPCKPGRYSLTAKGRERALQFCPEAHG